MHCFKSAPLTSPRRSGFTLMELLVVMVLIGLLAGLTMTRMGGVTLRARLQSAAERVSALDNAMRVHAIGNAEPVALRLDLEEATIERIIGSDGRLSRIEALSRVIKLNRFLSTTRDVGSGTITVDYSAQGTSETFAIELSAAHGQSTWLLFAGLTGQVTQWEDREDVERILHTLQTSRDDID